MFKTIFLKTLFEKRWMALWWTLGNIALVLFIVVLFPTMRDTFGEALKTIPESMQSFMGDVTDYQILSGYVSVQVFQQMIFMPVILGVILFTGLIGGEENEGTLQTLLTHPVSRSKVYFHKLAAAALILAIVTFGLFVGSWLGAVIISEPLPLWPTLQDTFMAWLVSFAISMIGFAVAASFYGKRAIAGSIAGAYAFVMYIITSLESIESLKNVQYFSPFHYFNHPSPLKASFDFGDMWILAGVSVVLIIVGYIFFIRRDVYQR